MKTILYTQADNPLEKDKIIVDEQLEDYLGTMEQKRNLNVLLSAREFNKIKLEPLPDFVSQNLELHYRKNNGFFIKGFYLKNNKSANRNYYSFFANTDDLDSALEILKNISVKYLQNECDNNDFVFLKQKYQIYQKSNILQKGIRFLKNRKIIKCSILITIIICLILVWVML